MSRNLALGFALVLGAGVIVDKGAGLAKAAFAGGGSSSTAAQVPAGTSGKATGGIGQVTPTMLTSAARPYGWSAAQIADWVKVIARESGGSAKARNPSSGAFGIGQFLGATLQEYAPYGATSSNPVDQLEAMAKYIHDRYGDPSAAWAHEESYGWY